MSPLVQGFSTEQQARVAEVCGVGAGDPQGALGVILSFPTDVSLTWTRSCRVRGEGSPCHPQLRPRVAKTSFSG